MNINFGLFPPTDPAIRKKQRKLAYTDRAKADLAVWIAESPMLSRA
jgi:methylenetetrahydrofolate--tRNA-(uracil-5-)-methyltransferase